MKRLTYDLLICSIKLPQAIQLEYFISKRRVNTKVKGVNSVTFKLLQNVIFNGATLACAGSYRKSYIKYYYTILATFYTYI